MKVENQMKYLCTMRQGYAVVKASGENILTYIQGQITQDVANLQVEQAVYAAILNHQSKAITDFYVIRTAASEVMLLCPADRAVALVERLRRYAMGYTLRIGVVSSWAVFAVQGEDVADFLIQRHLSVPDQTPFSVVSADDIFVMRWAEAAADGVWLIGDKARLTSWLPNNCDEREMIKQRILKGVPTFGVDWDEKIHPLNANLIERHGVSFDKGCYVGQEVTSRMHWRGGIKKKLYRVMVLAEEVQAPTAIFSTVKVGELTSVAQADAGWMGIALLPIEVVQADSFLSLENGAQVEVLGICA